MPNHAQATLAGHLGQDPVTRTTQMGESVTSFSLATNRKRRDESITTWWRCTCWGKRGEVIAQYLRKGDPILVTGEVCNRPWTDQDGSQRMSLDVEVRDFSFLGSKDAAQSAQDARGGVPQSGRANHAAGAPNATQGNLGASQAEHGFDPEEDIPF